MQLLHPDSPLRDLPRIRRRLGAAHDELAPNVIVFHPTDRCNHRCDWCWYDRSTDEILCDAVGRLLDNSVVRPDAVEEVILAGGGEPLLHPDINRIVQSIAAKCPSAQLKLDTNGALLRRLTVDTLRLVHYVRVSLDATDAHEYAATRHVKLNEWDRVLRNLEWVKSNAPASQLGVSLVEHRMRSDSEVESLANALSGIGVDWVFRKPLLSRDLSLAALAVEANTQDRGILARKGGEPEALLPTPPIQVASMLVLVGSDMGVYPCYHKQGQHSLRLASVEQCEAQGTTQGAEDVRSIWLRHASDVHPCRMHTAWAEYLSSRRDNADY